jgi:NAD(P)-dependent dehydrogenase (short-subunit alcohol dehydrogenase family)
MFKLNDKIAVVTGAGSGIGEMIANTFAEAGAYVYVADKNPEGGRAVVEKIHAADEQAEFVEVDVASEASCQAIGHHVS